MNANSKGVAQARDASAAMGANSDASGGSTDNSTGRTLLAVYERIKVLFGCAGHKIPYSRKLFFVAGAFGDLGCSRCCFDA
jgi:hypothetical protein